MAASSRRDGVLGVHSLDHFRLVVPDLSEAERFYSAFGLECRTRGDRLELYAVDSHHCWGSLSAGPRKRLDRVVLGVFEDDLEKFEARLKERNVERLAKLVDAVGLAFKDPSGNVVELRVGEKCSPSAKSSPTDAVRASAGRGAPLRGATDRVRPRRLSHALLFVRDVPESIAFYRDVAGLKLSDESGGAVAFMHGPHGSDHHLLAFAKSEGGGFHHCSWDVGTFEDVGQGGGQMAEAGYTHGWGLGRHVLGSNYFHYVRDPWGSFSEYSHDIDFIGADEDWQATSPPIENGFYLWGPNPPEDFVINHELGR